MNARGSGENLVMTPGVVPGSGPVPIQIQLGVVVVVVGRINSVEG